MATYAIGDVQGCYQSLMSLLEEIAYNPNDDVLWFAGDLVNRGPQSLEVLRFVAKQSNAIVVLGNHDFHLLTLTLANNPPEETQKHTMRDILTAPDRDELLHWLCQQKLMHFDAQLHFAMIHAGVSPQWDLATALACAHEVEQVLQGEHCAEFLDHLYGDQPDAWDQNLTGWDRLRYIVNVFCRMRYVQPDGSLILEVKGKPEDQPENFIPWYQVTNIQVPILFGHWASLEGKTNNSNAIALDTGCVWGGKLSALRLDDRQWLRVQCCDILS